MTPRLFAHPSNLAALVRNFSAWRAAAGALLAASLVVFVLAIASVVSRVASSWDSASSRVQTPLCPPSFGDPADPPPFSPRRKIAVPRLSLRRPSAVVEQGGSPT